MKKVYLVTFYLKNSNQRKTYGFFNLEDANKFIEKWKIHGNKVHITDYKVFECFDEADVLIPFENGR